jgi:MoxR-like ATPase
MAENQVSVEGTRILMDELFFVIATQNPVEFHGTYPLPEAQMDRFAMRFELGYVSREDEVKILDSQQYGHPLTNLKPCTNLEDVRSIRRAVNDIRISEELKHYIVDLVSATRNHPEIQMGASTRAAITMVKCSQALALIEGLDFVTPDIVQELAVPIIAHRLVLNTESQYSGADSTQCILEIMQDLPVPV